MNIDLVEVRHEARLFHASEMRSRKGRVAAALVTMVILLIAGHPRFALASLACITIAEGLSIIVSPRPLTSVDGVTRRHVRLVVLANQFTGIAFSLPAIALASDDNVAHLVGAFCWYCGTFFHVVSTFAYLPIFTRSALVPQIATGLIALPLAWGPVTAATPGQRALAYVLLALIAADVFNGIRMQRLIHSELKATRRAAQDRLRRLEEMTRLDGLTGLLNRRAFDDSVADMLASRPDGTQLAMMVIDLDRFKPVNDGYGHEAGDRVLCAIAGRLSDIAGHKGVASRFGGDEFALAFPDIPGEEAALALGRRVAQRLSRPITHAGHEIEVGASVGVSVSGAEAQTVSRLSANADQAMYRAKALSGASAVLFDRVEMGRRAGPRDRARLQAALEEGAIRPFYQPKIDLATLDICGFEALARWVDPSGRRRPPAEFFPLVGELGMQSALLDRIAGDVFQDIAALRDSGLDPGRVSINIPEFALATQTGRQRLDGLVDAFPEIVGNLTFEITEDVFIARAAEAIQATISRFRARGLRISLDDFGTGYASFQHLRQLDFDELKIDTSFTAGLGRDHTSDIIVKGFLYIARGLGVDVVAEGVETSAQEAELIKLDCTMAQGFRYGRAVPLDEVRQLLRIGRAGPPTAGLGQPR